MGILSDFLNLFFPPVCYKCNTRLTGNEEYICTTCIYKIPKTGYHKIKDNKLETFFAGRFPYERITSFAFFTKDGIIQNLVHELKYNNNPGIGIFLGELAASEIQNTLFFNSIDFLVPVPLHPKRERIRGYNQSQKIAEGISIITGIPICEENLIRVKNNPSQTTQSRYERWSNTEGIFNIRDYNLFEKKHILLIDDIITTGSTIESCAKVIVNNTIESKVSVFCIGTAI